ncbi:peptidase T [Tropicibacter sp. S64]|uniref:peptidase T n=1 Tax=Tropicibacter sp. S64 TaxID=3415122 RepID=UPI003C7C13F6
MTGQFDAELEARLVRYCAVDTQSDAASPSVPSTACQLDLSRMLKAELEEIGAQDVVLTEYGAVIATIPGTVEGPTVGFLAHVDTAPQFNATGVKPRVVRGYNGGAISFPDAPDLSLTPEAFPYLAGKVGHDIVTASGTTLLGADDKAGISIVMTAARHLLSTPGLRHGPVRVAFTPDEEIARGVHADLPKDLACDFAYTFDGGDLGDITYESFSADGAKVVVQGVSIHPGWATGKLVNATTLASKIVSMLPHATMAPENTADRDGFLHVTQMSGDADRMEITLILRDFERDGLAAKGAMLQSICEAVQATEPRARITCEITPQYRNMRYWLEEDMTPVDLARDSARAIGITPISVPIRGGTDGSRLTELGLPTPNLFCGMQNVHGPLEWVSVQDMAQATRLMLEIAQRAVR